MINAIDLCKKQIDKEKNKYKIYDKIYEIIEKKIINASTCNLYYIVYEIPEFLVGYTVYSLNDCNILSLISFTKYMFLNDSFCCSV